MRLSDYLDRFSWSQAELARQAGVSEQAVRRALKGETITRRSAEAIIAAIQRKYKEQGLRGAITMGSVKGLHISDLRRKKRAEKQEAADPSGQGNQGAQE